MNSAQKLDILLTSNVKSLHDFFDTMCPLTIKDGDIMKVNGQVTNGKTYEAIGIIAISGDCNGSVALHMPKSCGEKVAKHLLNVDRLESEAPIYDTIGEMASIVAGGAKTLASYSDINFNISCPTVVRGDTHVKVEPSQQSVVGNIHFKIDDHDVLLVVSLMDN